VNTVIRATIEFCDQLYSSS